MKNFDVDAFFFKYRYYIFILLLGVILIGLGVFASKKATTSPSKVVVEESADVVAEVAGEVLKPGVYKLTNGARVEDLIVMAGGLTAGADRNWIDKNLNRAAKLTDGQKVYIPAASSQSVVLSAKSNGENQTISTPNSTQGSGQVNINSASAQELDALSGIGPVYAQNIVDHRPYSIGDDLVSKKVISQSVYNKIKDKISVY